MTEAAAGEGEQCWRLLESCGGIEEGEGEAAGGGLQTW